MTDGLSPTGDFFAIVLCVAAVVVALGMFFRSW